MLSYMVPSIEEKPPPVPNKSHLQLELEAAAAAASQPPHLTNGHPKRIIKTQSKTSTISAESSASSLSSVVSEVPATHISLLTPSQDKPKHKLITNGGAKHPTLKRVSFGSSKGSMVETLIYESPLQEEPEPNPSSDQASVDSNQGSESGKASKVRVTFFECEKPLVVNSPEPSDQADGLDAPFSMTSSQSPSNPDQPPSYNRQASTDSGWDNPFRPDGDLSREADEIVELIKGGKPITPTPGSTAPEIPAVEENGGSAPVVEKATPVSKTVSQNAATPAAKDANGSAPAVSNGDTPAQVEPQRGTLIAPSDQVEHVTLKKKPKCKCCVIQ